MPRETVPPLPAVADLLQRLEQGITELGDSERWRQFMRAQASFHCYSWSNSLLIALQRPDATRVAGLRAWNRLGRSVRAGERGIRILAPLVRGRRREGDDVTDPIATPVIVGYRPAYVFDIAQTEGSPLPLHPCQALTGDAPDSVLMRLWAELVRRGFLVVDADLPEGCNGSTSFLPPIIRLRRGLSAAQRLKTLAHEFAHAVLHDPRRDEPVLERPIQELEAESVAYIVCHHVGVATEEYSLGYIATWAGGTPEAVAALRRTATRVGTAAQLLISVATEEEDQGERLAG